MTTTPSSIPPLLNALAEIERLRLACHRQPEAKNTKKQCLSRYLGKSMPRTEANDRVEAFCRSLTCRGSQRWRGTAQCPLSQSDRDGARCATTPATAGSSLNSNSPPAQCQPQSCSRNLKTARTGHFPAGKLSVRMSSKSAAPLSADKEALVRDEGLRYAVCLQSTRAQLRGNIYHLAQ